MWISKPEDDGLFSADLLDMDPAEITRVIRQDPYDPEKFKVPKRMSTEARSIPMMAISFHRHAMNTGTIPPHDTYWKNYEDENSNFIHQTSADDLPNIKWRVMRAYPSLVRDVHFVSVARDLGFEAHRTLKGDIEGIDATVPTSTGDINVRLFFDSPNSRRFKLAKAIEHNPERFIDFGLSRDNRTELGNLYLYSTESIGRLFEKMEALRK